MPASANSTGVKHRSLLWLAEDVLGSLVSLLHSKIVCLAAHRAAEVRLKDAWEIKWAKPMN